MAKSTLERAFALAIATAIASTSVMGAALPAFAYTQREQIVSAGHGRISPGYLVVHETANPGASAANHVAYWRNNQPSVEMAHYVMELDGSVVYHTQRDDTKAYHVGRGNAYTVGIELAHATNADDAGKQFDEAAKWCADYLKARDWGIDRLLSHNDCRFKWGGTDHTDPTGYFKQYGRDWDMFKRRVLSYMNTGTGSTAPVKPAPAPQPGTSAPHGNGGFAAGAYRCTVDALNVRAFPGLSGAPVATYRKGMTVDLDPWYTVADGYVWGRYTSYGGKIRYIAVGRATGRPEPGDYLVKVGSQPAPAPSGRSYGPGRYTFRYTVKIRTGAGTGYKSVGVYKPGQSVYINEVVNRGGYAWGRYTSYSGHTRYVALGVTGGQTYVR